MNSLWLRIGALVLLGSYLLWKQLQRSRLVRLQEAAWRAHRGKGFDGAQARLRIGELRERYPELARQHRRGSEAHEEFTAVVRESVRRLPFFSQREETQTEIEQPDGGQHTI